MRRLLIAGLTVALLGSGAMARSKPTRFWNLTLYTVTSLQISPAGKNEWGPDQCKNDKDGTVDHDERLRVEGVTTGKYDVKLADKIGRQCIVRNVVIKQGGVFVVDEKQLTDCTK